MYMPASSVTCIPVRMYVSILGHRSWTCRACAVWGGGRDRRKGRACKTGTWCGVSVFELVKVFDARRCIIMYVLPYDIIIQAQISMHVHVVYDNWKCNAHTYFSSFPEPRQIWDLFFFSLANASSLMIQLLYECDALKKLWQYTTNDFVYPVKCCNTTEHDSIVTQATCIRSPLIKRANPIDWHGRMTGVVKLNIMFSAVSAHFDHI